jgi:hypothetical protein
LTDEEIAVLSRWHCEAMSLREIGRLYERSHEWAREVKDSAIAKLKAAKFELPPRDEAPPFVTKAMDPSVMDRIFVQCDPGSRRAERASEDNE